MKFPKPVFRGSSESLKDLLETNRREDEARRRRCDEFALGEFSLNLRSRDRLSKTRVRGALPARDDRDLVDLVNRLVQEASINYWQLRMQGPAGGGGFLATLGGGGP